jgi:hypothetical protein
MGDSWAASTSARLLIGLGMRHVDCHCNRPSATVREEIIIAIGVVMLSPFDFAFTRVSDEDRHEIRHRVALRLAQTASP